MKTLTITSLCILCSVAAASPDPKGANNPTYKLTHNANGGEVGFFTNARSSMIVQDREAIVFNVDIDESYVGDGETLTVVLQDKDNKALAKKVLATKDAPKPNPLRQLAGDIAFLPSKDETRSQAERARRKLMELSKGVKSSTNVEKFLREAGDSLDIIKEAFLSSSLSPQVISDAMIHLASAQQKIEDLAENPGQDDSVEELVAKANDDIDTLVKVTPQGSSARGTALHLKNTISHMTQDRDRLDRDSDTTMIRQDIFSLQGFVDGLDDNSTSQNALFDLTRLSARLRKMPASSGASPKPMQQVSFVMSDANKNEWPGDMFVKFVKTKADSAKADTTGKTGGGDTGGGGDTTPSDPSFNVTLSRPGGAVQLAIGFGLFGTFSHSKSDVQFKNATDALGNNLTVGGKQLYTAFYDSSKVGITSADGFVGISYLLPDALVKVPRNFGWGRTGFIAATSFTGSPQRAVFGLLQYLNRDETIGLAMGPQFVNQLVPDGPLFAGGYYLSDKTRTRWSKFGDSWFIGLIYNAATSTIKK